MTHSVRVQKSVVEEYLGAKERRGKPYQCNDNTSPPPHRKAKCTAQNINRSFEKNNVTLQSGIPCKSHWLLVKALISPSRMNPTVISESDYNHTREKVFVR